MNYRFVLSSVIGLSSIVWLAFGSAWTSGRAQTTKVRTYHIGIIKQDWDYAPSKYNLTDNTPLEQDPNAQVFTVTAPNRIGRVYSKARYVEYTDSSFTKTRASTDPIYKARYQHLGLIGPVIYAEVGDTVRVLLKNMTAKADKFPFSLHIHGLKYDKKSEGAPYSDGTGGNSKTDDAIMPGQSHLYEYTVPEDAGPGPMDPSSVTWMYHSHTDEVRDTYAGLIGPVVVTRQGQAKADGSPKDVDREFFTLFQVFNENNSPYFEQNLKRIKKPKLDDEFAESNLMHAINGFVYGNTPGLNMRLGERVRWNVIAMGTEVDLHTPHWHGQTVMFSGMRMDMLELLPGSMKVADMVPRTAGTWLFHCHVNDHITAGMSARFTVRP
jgi:manganese oxidase